jgi:hypothetical protein
MPTTRSRHYSYVESLLQTKMVEVCEPESGDETPQVSPVSLSEALAGLATLRLYEEQQEDGSRDLVRTLNRLERELQGKRANRGVQTQIDTFGLD